MNMKNSTVLDEPLHTSADWLKSASMYDPYQDMKKIAKAKKKKFKYSAKLNKRYSNECLVLTNFSSSVIDTFVYYDNPDRYFNDVYFLITSIKDDIRNEECRSSYINFKLSDNKVYHMSTIHFLFNMVMWMPFFALNIPIDKDKIFMPKTFTNKTYIKYINDKIIEPYKHLTTMNQMSQILSKMYDIFVRICDIYSIDLGISFSLYDMISRWDNPEMYNINHFEIPKKCQISEMEKLVNEQTARYKQIWENEIRDENNSISVLIRSEQINTKQLKEFTVSIGTKPDINGDTYPHIPSPGANLMVNGMRKCGDAVADAAGGRKAAILALNIDSGGYLDRTFVKSCSNIRLHKDPDYDCGSENFYVYTIHNKEELEEMRGRWYRTGYNTLRQLIDTDYDMIGKTLEFRSPVTCASKHGICATCYGHLYNQNYGTNVGVNSSLKLLEKNYQNSMSAKHVLDTSTTFIEFNDEFNEYFYLDDGYRIKIRNDIENYSNYELHININFIQKFKNVEDMERNEFVQDFILYDIERDEEITLMDKNKGDIYFADQLFNIIKKRRRHKKYDDKGWININLSKLSCDKDIFYVRLRNHELIKPLKDLKSFIEKGSKLDVDTYSELIDKLKYLMKCGGIYTESIHIEILCRNLVRDKYNKINVPDWSKKDPEYIITSVHNSIFWSDSIINSMSFEKLKNQLKDPLTYRKKSTSYYDTFFLLNY